MANVQRRMETMIDEFEVMVRTGICTKDECRIIKKRMREFESKLSGHSPSLDIYKAYIAYDLTIYRLIKARRNKLRCGEKKNDLEHKILQRIKVLYEKSMQRNPKDEEIYLNYFKFCRECHYVHAATKICEKMIQYHSKNEEIWLVAARWHLNDGNDINEAMSYIKRGLAIHKDSQSLYCEYVFCEVRTVKNGIVKDENQQQKCVIMNERLKVVFGKMFIYIKELEPYVGILQLLENYDFTLFVQELILNHLFQEHKDSEYFWDFLAQREKRGYHYVFNNLSTTSNKHFRIMFCIKKYEEGLDTVPVDQKQALMNSYLKCLFDFSNEDFKNAKIEKRDVLIGAFERASADGYLSEECYLSWLEMVMDSEANRILSIATEKYPKSINLWNIRLRHEIIRDCHPNIINTFKHGIESLKEESSQLWILTLRYLIVSTADEEIERFYKDAIKQHPNISNLFKPKYFEWVALKYETEEWREMFYFLFNQKPYCKEMYTTMLSLETNLLLENNPEVEKVHLIGIKLLGTEDVDVYINYIEYHMYLDSNENDKLLTIYNQAKERLPDHLFIEFEEKYQAIRDLKHTQISSFKPL